MDQTESPQVQYASFLVRLWRSGESKADGSWQGEVEHIQSGQICRFDSLAGLNRVLRELCTVAEARPNESLRSFTGRRWAQY